MWPGQDHSSLGGAAVRVAANVVLALNEVLGQTPNRPVNDPGSAGNRPHEGQANLETIPPIINSKPPQEHVRCYQQGDHAGEQWRLLQFLIKKLI